MVDSMETMNYIERHVFHSELLPPTGDCYRSRGLERVVLERELSGDTAARAYRSRGLERAVLERERDLSGGIQQQRRIEVGVWRDLCWRESLRGEQRDVHIGRSRTEK